MITFRQPFQGEFPITQKYGELIPGVTHKNRPHTGIDYGCPEGTEILASADGEVLLSDFDLSGYGNTIIIQHSDGNATLYAHLAQRFVKLHQQVKQGQVIGTSDSTGNVTGPHLHFEARRRWNDYKSHFDPMDLPLMTVDDAAQYPQTAGPKALMPAGVYKVICEYAFIRTWPDLRRDRILLFGELVYIFDDVKYSDSGLPYHFIGAGRCIAEYDTDGTQLIERVS